MLGIPIHDSEGLRLLGFHLGLLLYLGEYMIIEQAFQQALQGFRVRGFRVYRVWGSVFWALEGFDVMQRKIIVISPHKLKGHTLNHQVT